jgi:hypothetical protein
MGAAVVAVAVAAGTAQGQAEVREVLASFSYFTLALRHKGGT